MTIVNQQLVHFLQFWRFSYLLIQKSNRFALIEVGSYFFKTLWKEVDPWHYIHMLFWQLWSILYPRVVIKTTTHEITSFTVVFTFPAVFYGFIYGLFLHQFVVTLSFQEISVPFLQFPEILAEEVVHLLDIAFMELSLLYFIDEGQDGEDESGRIHLKGILIDKLHLGHEGTHLKPSDLFPADPSEQIDLLNPSFQHIYGQGGVVMNSYWEVKAIVPQKPSGEDESWRGKWMEGVELVSDEWVLGVQTALVEGYSSVQIIEDVFEKGRVLRVGLNIEIFVVKLLRYF